MVSIAIAVIVAILYCTTVLSVRDEYDSAHQELGNGKMAMGGEQQQHYISRRGLQPPTAEKSTRKRTRKRTRCNKRTTKGTNGGVKGPCGRTASLSQTKCVLQPRYKLMRIRYFHNGYRFFYYWRKYYVKICYH